MTLPTNYVSGTGGGTPVQILPSERLSLLRTLSCRLETFKWLLFIYIAIYKRIYVAEEVEFLPNPLYHETRKQFLECRYFLSDFGRTSPEVVA